VSEETFKRFRCPMRKCNRYIGSAPKAAKIKPYDPATDILHARFHCENCARDYDVVLPKPKPGATPVDVGRERGNAVGDIPIN